MAPDPSDDVPAGVGSELAGWAIDAMDGHPHEPVGSDEATTRRVRRVNAAIEALQAAKAASRTDDDA